MDADLTALRRQLNQAFDDVGLVALIQDELPALADRIGLARGLRKDEFPNSVIDGFLRNSEVVSHGRVAIRARLRLPVSPISRHAAGTFEASARAVWLQEE